jgi:K+-sensing histidine kinase KdpD
VEGIVEPGATEAGDQELVVDPELFRRVVRDLWQAASLAPTPRELRLEVTTRGPWTELRVVRTGDPVPHHVLQALFDPFDLNDDATGITIGLYLARALVVAHGGTLGLEQDDRGAVFHVRVPRTRPSTEDREAGGSQEE